MKIFYQIPFFMFSVGKTSECTNILELQSTVTEDYVFTHSEPEPNHSELIGDVNHFYKIPEGCSINACIIEKSDFKEPSYDQIKYIKASKNWEINVGTTQDKSWTGAFRLNCNQKRYSSRRWDLKLQSKVNLAKTAPFEPITMLASNQQIFMYDILIKNRGEFTNKYGFPFNDSWNPSIFDFQTRWEILETGLYYFSFMFDNHINFIIDDELIFQKDEMKQGNWFEISPTKLTKGWHSMQINLYQEYYGAPRAMRMVIKGPGIPDWENFLFPGVAHAQQNTNWFSVSYFGKTETLNCQTSLSKKSNSQANNEFEFDEQLKQKIIVGDYTDFFIQQSNLCPISKCLLMTEDDVPSKYTNLELQVDQECPGFTAVKEDCSSCVSGLLGCQICGNSGKCCLKDKNGTCMNGKSEDIGKGAACVNKNNCYHIQIIAPTSIVLGYTESLILTCQNSIGKTLFQTISSDPFTVTQKSGCSLVPNEVQELFLEQSQTIVESKIIDDYMILFTNRYPKTCLVQSCELMNKNCVEAIPDQKKIKLEVQSLVAATNVIEGYDIEICMQCKFENNEKLYNSKNVRISQDKKCQDKFTIFQEIQSEFEETFNDTKQSFELNLVKYINIKDKENCELSKLVLLDDKCLEPSKSENFKLNLNNTLSAKINVEKGYSAVVCIKFSNSFKSVNQLIQLTQYRNCETSFTQRISPSSNSFSLDYKEETQYIQLIEDVISLFSNQDALACKINSCSVNSQYLKIDNFSLSAKANVEEGYNEESVQIKCQINEKMIVQLEEIKLTQFRNCQTSFTQEIFPSRNSFSLDFEEETPYIQLIEDITSLFINKDALACKITQCSVNSQFLKIEDFSLSAKTNVEEGYNEERIQIKCQINGKIIIKLDEIKLTQFRNCQTSFTQEIFPSRNSFSLDFEEETPYIQLIEDITSLFRNKDALACKITSCSVNSQFLKIDDFSLSAKANVEVGYNKEKVQIKCEINEKMIVKLEAISVIQKKKTPKIVNYIPVFKAYKVQIKNIKVDEVKEESVVHKETLTNETLSEIIESPQNETSEEEDEKLDEDEKKEEKKKQQVKSTFAGVVIPKELNQKLKNLQRRNKMPIFESEEDEDEITPLGFWVEEFNQLGYMKVQFNQSLEPSLFELSDLTPYLIDIYVEPFDPEEVDEENLKFIWEATKVDYDLAFIEIQINFKKALWISAGEKEDQIKLDIINMAYFQPKGLYGRRLQEIELQEPIKSTMKIKRQMPNNDESKNLQTQATQLNDSLSMGTLVIFLLQVYILSVFKKLMSSLMALQIVVHLGILNVKIPGNTTFFIATLKQVTYFKLFAKLEKLTTVVISFDFQGQNKLLNDHMIITLQGMGFKYFNCILNLGNTGQMIGLNLFIILALMLIYSLQKYHKRRWQQRRLRDMKKKMFYFPFLAIAINGFMPICIATNLNSYQHLDTTTGEKFANFFSFYLWTYIFIWFPLAMLLVIFSGPDKQVNPDFKHKYKYLLSGIKTKTKFQRSYFFIFILRRFLLIETGLLLFDYSCIQVQLIMFLNILILIYLGFTNANCSKLDYILSLNTEMFMAIVCYHLIAFTDFVPNKETQYLMGKSFMVWICLLLAINLNFVFKEIYRLFKLISIKKLKLINSDTKIDKVQNIQFLKSIQRISIRVEKERKMKRQRSTSTQIITKLSIIIEQNEEAESSSVEGYQGGMNDILNRQITKLKNKGRRESWKIQKFRVSNLI